MGMNRLAFRAFWSTAVVGSRSDTLKSCEVTGA